MSWDYNAYIDCIDRSAFVSLQRFQSGHLLGWHGAERCSVGGNEYELTSDWATVQSWFADDADLVRTFWGHSGRSLSLALTISFLRDACCDGYCVIVTMTNDEIEKLHRFLHKKLQSHLYTYFAQLMRLLCGGNLRLTSESCQIEFPNEDSRLFEFLPPNPSSDLLVLGPCTQSVPASTSFQPVTIAGIRGLAADSGYILVREIPNTGRS